MKIENTGTKRDIQKSPKGQSEGSQKLEGSPTGQK